MKKLLLIASAIIVCTTSVFAMSNNAATADTVKTKKVKPVKVQYTCIMHPEVLSDKPGKCPKCGMTLVKRTNIKKKAN